MKIREKLVNTKPKLHNYVIKLNLNADWLGGEFTDGLRVLKP